MMGGTLSLILCDLVTPCDLATTNILVPVDTVQMLTSFISINLNKKGHRITQFIS